MVLQELHEGLGHTDETRTGKASSTQHWWSSLSSNAPDFCQMCITWSSFKESHCKAIAPLQPNAYRISGQNSEHRHYRSSTTYQKGNRYILVKVYYYTNVAKAESMESEDDSVWIAFTYGWQLWGRNQQTGLRCPCFNLSTRRQQ